MSDGFEVDRVIATGNVQELICQVITLPAPAEEIKEIRKTVIIDNCLVQYDKVILDGRLRKDVMFKTAATGFPLPGTVQGCVGTTSTVAGTLADIDLEIAFNALISVPGARPGDRCVILQAFVEGEKEEAANIQANGTFLALIDKSIIFVCVKVVRETLTSTLTGGGVAQVAPCPTRRSTGFFAGSEDGTPPPARPGLVAGSFVGPTGMFPGVLNPGIPTTLPLANTITTLTGSQVQLNQLQQTTTTPGTIPTP